MKTHDKDDIGVAGLHFRSRRRVLITDKVLGVHNCDDRV
jgi:hypothetical protein